VVALALLSNAIAHMILSHPKPYGALTLNNSPLDASGADFPCKQRSGVYDLADMNYWKAGERQSVSFRGTAAHGGGSCQFSVTTDMHPTKSSRWKVIRSVVGGCPASTDGNLVGDEHAETFEILIPKDLPGANYTFAWTWFNRRGPREMYMNCAPVSVSGSGGNTMFLDGLPDMFVANLPGTPCSTVEGLDSVFPEPGDSVSTGSPVTIAALQGTQCTSAALGSGGVAANGHPSEPLPSVALAAVEMPDVTKAAEMSALSPTASAAVPSAPPKPADGELLATQLHSISPQTEPGVPVTCVPCRGDGSIVCIDETHFGLCDRGCVARQAVSKGTSCLQGSIVGNRQR
jgi:hypothetical protein